MSEVHVERDGTVHVTGTLHTSHHRVVDEHRSAAGVALHPGTGHIELYLAALRAAPRLLLEPSHQRVIDIAEVPGEHNAMFYPENAPRLAEVLGAVLDRHEL